MLVLSCIYATDPRGHGSRRRAAWCPADLCALLLAAKFNQTKTGGSTPVGCAADFAAKNKPANLTPGYREG